MKKLPVALLVIGAIAVAVVYLWVGSYTKRVDQREQILLQQQQEAYEHARAKRIRDWQAESVAAALRGKLGLTDHPTVQLQITHQEPKEGSLEGVVEVQKPGSVSGQYETSSHAFRIEFNADDDSVEACEILVP